MIAKIQLSHPGMKGTLDYNERKVAAGHAERIGTVNVGNNEKEIRELFSLYERRNIRTDKVSFQMSLNPDPDNPAEALDDATAIELACKLMNKLGYGGQPIAIYRHNDIDREHFHIVSIRVTENGKRLKQKSRLEKKVLMKELNCLAKTYGYTVGESDKSVKADRKRPAPVDRPASSFAEGTTDIAQQMRDILDEALTYRFTTFLQLALIMEHHGVLLTKATSGERERIVMQGMDAAGEKCTQPIMQDEYGEDLMRLCEEAAGRNREERCSPSKAERERLMRELKVALEQSASEADLKERLIRKGIGIRLSRTKGTGEVFGVTLVDHRSRMAYKGSEISRELTAALFRTHEQRWSAGCTEAAARSAAAGTPKESATGTVKERGQEAALAAERTRSEERAFGGADTDTEGTRPAEDLPGYEEQTEDYAETVGDLLSGMLEDRGGRPTGQTADGPSKKKKRKPKGRTLTG